MKEDCKKLEEYGLMNVCPVRILDEETNTLVDSHIIFSQWVGNGPEPFKLYKNDNGTFRLYRHNKCIRRDIKLENIYRYTERLKPILVNNHGQFFLREGITEEDFGLMEDFED